MWRRHDEKLAEQAYRDRDSFFQQEEERPLIHQPGADRTIAKAVRDADDALHEEPDN